MPIIENLFLNLKIVFIGILGGNLGLFLGASMVTMIEVVVFCISWWCGWDDRNRQSLFRKETVLLEDKKN